MHSNFVLCNSWPFSGAYIVSLFFGLSTNLDTHAVTLNSLYNDECLLSSISKRSGPFTCAPMGSSPDTSLAS